MLIVATMSTRSFTVTVTQNVDSITYVPSQISAYSKTYHSSKGRSYQLSTELSRILQD